MLYRVLRFIMSASLKFYFKEVKFIQPNKIPSNKPVIIIANHTNAFLDAILMAAAFSHPLHFIGRGDVMHSWLKWILKQLNYIPVYRLQEGYALINKNRNSFSQCLEVLKKNQTLLVFPEGICTQQYGLQPLKKGIARIAVEALNTMPDLEVIAAGIYYSSFKKARAQVYVNFSQPISVKDFLLENPQTENEKVKIVTLKFEQLLKEQMLFIPAETLPVFNLITGSQPSKANTSTYAFLKSIADQLHTLVTFQKKCYQKVEITYEGLKKEWAQTGLKEHLVIHKNRTWYQHLLLTFPFAPIAVIVLLLNAPPLLLSKIIVKRIVKNPNFKASAALAMGTLFVLLNSVLLFCIVYITLNIYAAIFFILILFPALRYSLKMLDFFQEGFRDLLDLKIFIFKHYLFKKLMVRQKKLLYTFKGA